MQATVPWKPSGGWRGGHSSTWWSWGTHSKHSANFFMRGIAASRSSLLYAPCVEEDRRRLPPHPLPSCLLAADLQPMRCIRRHAGGVFKTVTARLVELRAEYPHDCGVREEVFIALARCHCLDQRYLWRRRVVDTHNKAGAGELLEEAGLLPLSCVALVRHVHLRLAAAMRGEATGAHFGAGSVHAGLRCGHNATAVLMRGCTGIDDTPRRCARRQTPHQARRQGAATRLLAAIEVSVDQFVWYLTCCEEDCVQHETDKIRCGCYSCGRGIAAHGAQHRGHTDEGMLRCVSAQNAGTRWPSRAPLLLDCLWRWRNGAQRPSSQTCEMSNFRSADSDSPPTPEEHGC